MHLPAFLDPRDLLIWVNEGPFTQGLALAKADKKTVASTFIDQKTSVVVRHAFHSIIQNAFTRDDKEISCLHSIVQQFGAPAVRILLVLWHEQRHFLDYIFTNYGASQYRLGFMIRSQLQTILEGAVIKGEIGFPLREYRSTTRLKLLGMSVDGPHPLAGLATVLADRKERDDRDTTNGYEIADSTTSVRLRSGKPLSLNGPNMLEALATVAQLELLQRILGMPLYGEKWNELGAAYTRIPYLAPFGNSLESAGVKVLDWLISEQSGYADIYINPFILTATLVASLMCRRANPHNQNVDQLAFSPSTRFAIIREIIKQSPKKDIRDANDGYNFVNNICKKLWGRSISDDLEEDIEFSEKESVKFEAAYPLDKVNNPFMRSYIAARRALLRELDRAPGSLCGGNDYTQHIMPNIRPRFVFVDPASDGLVIFATKEQLSEGLELVEGLEERFNVLVADTSSTKFGMEMVRIYCYESRNDGAGSILGVKLSAGQSTNAVKTSGLLRLLLNGRADPVGVDFLMYHQEKRLKNAGIKIKFESDHKYPLIGRDPSYLFELFDLKEMNCDITDEPITKYDSAVVSPWEFERHPKLLEAAEARGKRLLSPFLNNDDTYSGFGEWRQWVVKKELLSELS